MAGQILTYAVGGEGAASLSWRGGGSQLDAAFQGQIKEQDLILLRVVRSKPTLRSSHLASSVKWVTKGRGGKLEGQMGDSISTSAKKCWGPVTGHSRLAWTL